MSLNAWREPSTRIRSAPATSSASSSTDAGRCIRAAAYAWFPAQLVSPTPATLARAAGGGNTAQEVLAASSAVVSAASSALLSEVWMIFPGILISGMILSAVTSRISMMTAALPSSR